MNCQESYFDYNQQPPQFLGRWVCQEAI